MMVVGFFEKTFSEVLLNTIEEVLTNIFREKTAKTIIQSIKLAYNLPREEMYSTAVVLHVALLDILGRGTEKFEGLVVKKICSKLGNKYELGEGTGFLDRLDELCKIFEEKRKGV